MSSENNKHDITQFQKTFTRTSVALAMMVSAIPVAIGWTDAIPTLSDTHQKFSQVNVSVTSFSAIGLIYYYRDALSSAFLNQDKSGVLRSIIRHAPLIFLMLSFICTYLYFKAYEDAGPDEFWPLLAYSGIFVFPAMLLAMIALKDFATNR